MTAVAITQLYDINVGGEMRKVIGADQSQRVLLSIDRNNGQFLRRQAVHDGELDLRPRSQDRPAASTTMRPRPSKTMPANRRALRQEGGRRAPGSLRHADLMPNTYDPARGLRLFQRHDRRSQLFQFPAADPEKQLIGSGFREIYCGSPTKDNAVEPVERSVRNPNCKVSHGLLGGIDIHTGDTVKKLESYYPAYSGVLGTAGDLLFMGDIMGKISAYDKDTMKQLWSFETGTAFAGSPMTYSVNGKQYVASSSAARLGPRRRLVPGGRGARAERDPDGVRPLMQPARVGKIARRQRGLAAAPERFCPRGGTAGRDRVAWRSRVLAWMWRWPRGRKPALRRGSACHGDCAADLACPTAAPPGQPPRRRPAGRGIRRSGLRHQWRPAGITDRQLRELRDDAARNRRGCAKSGFVTTTSGSTSRGRRATRMRSPATMR